MEFENDVLKASNTVPVVAQFSANWCGPCKAMKPLLDQIIKEREDFNLVVVDVDTNPMPSMTYGIRSVPTMILFKGGKPIASRRGMASAKQFNDWLTAALNT
jgi:thioredoxin 1